MSDTLFHRCEQGPDFVTVVIKDGALKFVDEYEFEINFCPYCGESAAELMHEAKTEDSDE